VLVVSPPVVLVVVVSEMATVDEVTTEFDIVVEPDKS